MSSGNPTEYARHLYLNGKEVTSATVPEGISRLGYTFHNCINLTEVTLPTTVTDLGAYTFAGTGITRLPLTEAIDRIPDGTFSDCPSLPDTVVIPANIKFINRSAFSGSPIDCLFLPATIRLMDTRSFEATGLRHIFSPAYLAPCTINTLDDPHGGWSAFDETTYSDAVLHIPPGADYADRFDEATNEFISGWTWFEHIEEYGVPVTAIAFGQPSLTLAEAASAERAVEFTPSEWVDKRLTWASSNPAVARVEECGLGRCRVSALNSGRAAVTATTTDGTLLTATCVVTVGDAVAGDVNGDGRVDVDDLNIVINVILDMNQEPATMAFCDVNSDGGVDVDDLNLLINVILSNNSVRGAD